MASALIVAPVARANPPAVAWDEDFYAYAGGAATSPAGCPQTDTADLECTLTQALAIAPAGASVLLATGGSDGTYYGNFTIATAGTSASAPLTLEPAAGVTAPVIDGDASAVVPCPTASCARAVLTVNPGVDAALTSITITDGNNTKTNGGGCVNDMGDVTLTQVVVTSCAAYNGGGAAVGANAAMTISGSTFDNDTARSFGGAIENGNSGTGTLIITDSTFSADTAAYHGGAIENGVRAGSASASVTDATFTNDSSEHGGAIDNGDTGTGTLTVASSTFAGDSATIHGGAIDNGDGSAGIGTLTVTGSAFAGDSSPHGGAIDNGETAGTGTLTVQTSTFSGNSTTGQGDAIENGDSKGVGSAVILTTTFDGNTGNAAIDVAKGSVQIAGSIVADSTGANCTGPIADAGYNLEDDAAAGCGFSEHRHDLVDVSPDLSSLASNGGLTQTMEPGPASPVLGAIPNPAVVLIGAGNQQVTICPTSDQAGDPSLDEAYGCSVGSVDPANDVPAVTSLSTQFGPATGGQALTIEGGNFTAGDSVQFGGASAASVTVNSANEITVTTPPQPTPPGTGMIDVTVTSPGGQASSANPADLYSYYPQDWSSYLGGPSHDSFNPVATSISSSDLSNLSPIWQWPPPKAPNTGSQADFASPIVYDGVVYVGLADGEMYAISEATQKILWSQFLGFVTSTTCAGTDGIDSTATVAVDPGTGNPVVYVNAPDGYLVAMDAATGNILWQSVVGIPSTTQNDYYAWGSPTVANGKVYIGISAECDHPLVVAGVLSFDQHTGSQIAFWDDQPTGVVGGSIWSSVAVLPDGNVVATTGNSQGNRQIPNAESVVVLDGSTLRLLDAWQVPKSQQIFDSDFGGSPTIFTAAPSGVATTMIGACNKNGSYYAFRADDVSAGPVWQAVLGAAAGSGPAGGGECIAAAIWDGQQLIVGGGSPTTINGVSYNGSVAALDPATGQPIWQTGLPGYVLGSPSEDGAGVVAVPVYYAPNNQAGVYLLSASTGAIVQFLSTSPTGAFAQPVFDGNTLLVGDLDSLPLTAYAITTPGQADPISVSPGTVQPGTTVTVTITGASGLTSPANVVVSGTAVRVASVKILSSSSASVRIVVSNAAPAGAELNVTLVEPNLTSFSCDSCLTVG